MLRLSRIWDDLCGLIIRPQRARYTLGSLGPKFFRLEDSEKVYERIDVQIENPRGMLLEGSWCIPAGLPKGTRIPCVIYSHGNCGCRRDAFEAAETLLPMGIGVFAFDFAGSGLSEGEYVTLGFYERQDLAAVVEFVQASGRCSAIGLWGRSMGAVSSIMYASKDPTIRAVIADSPFSSLYQIILDLVASHKNWIPRAAISVTVSQMRRSIMNRAEFDIYDLDCIKYAQQCDVPIIICHGIQDDFVTISHAHAIKDAYRGSDCTLMELAGDHNSLRPLDFMHDAGRFLRRHLGQPVLVVVNDTALRTTIMARLSSLSFKAVSVRTAREAPEALARHRRYGLVMVDDDAAEEVSLCIRRSEDPLVSGMAVVRLHDSRYRRGPVHNKRSNLRSVSQDSLDGSNAGEGEDRAVLRAQVDDDADDGLWNVSLPAEMSMATFTMKVEEIYSMW
eukprot:PhM_4_TR17468/c0_g1_i1/m.85719